MRTTEKKSTIAAGTTGTTGTSSNTQAFAQLRMRTLNGAYLRFGYMLPKKVSERLDWELGVIQNRGVADYFLMVQDLVNAARQTGLFAMPGFDAAAGSMVAYCLFVTDINPLDCNLLFEAFLNPDGTSQPEMEIVMAEGDKAGVSKWLAKHYGKEQLDSLTVGLVELRACSIIKETLDNLRKSKKICFDVDSIPLGDGETARKFQVADTVGIFRFEEPAMQAYLYGIQPVSFEELVAVYALGQMNLSERTNRYIRNRQSWDQKGVRKYALPGMEQFLEQTYGVTIFPEQVMQLAQLLAGFTPGESDMLREVMAHRQVSEMMELKEKFLRQGAANGYYPEVLEKIWLDWEKLLPHACLKSHAAGVTLTAYRMAYLKVHYPAAFMAASLNHHKDDMDAYMKLWNELDGCNYFIF